MPLNAYGWKVLIGLYEISIAPSINNPANRSTEIVVSELYVKVLCEFKMSD